MGGIITEVRKNIPELEKTGKSTDQLQERIILLDGYYCTADYNYLQQRTKS